MLSYIVKEVGIVVTTIGTCHILFICLLLNLTKLIGCQSHDNNSVFLLELNGMNHSLDHLFGTIKSKVITVLQSQLYG